MPTLTTQALFEQAFGAPWRRGPIPTALDALQSDLRKVGGWQSPRRFPEAALHGGTETPMLWTRELRPDELRRRWVVGFDKHAAYLGVLGGLELGIGTPQRDAGSALASLDRRRPGYWRVECTYPPVAAEWPDALGRPARVVRARERWVTSPTLELALELDFEPDIREAWTWPVHRRLLRPFGDRCQSARRTLAAHAVTARREQDSPAYAAAQDALVSLKHVYAPIMGGFFARLKDRERSPRPPWYRPDWRHAIIAKARANLHRNMLTWRARGGVPIGTYNDAVYFASDEPPIELAARIGIRLDDSLGGLKVLRARPLDQVVRDGRLSWRPLLSRDGK